jgi:hypothetical protein
MGVSCGTHGGEQKCVLQKWFVGKPEGRRPLQRYKRIWEYNIKIDDINKQMVGQGLHSPAQG